MTATLTRTSVRPQAATLPPRSEWRRLQHLASAAAAMAVPRGPAVALPPFGTAAAARAWLDAHLPALLAVPDPAFARRLAPVLADYLEATGRHHEAAELSARALVDGDRPAERIRLARALTRIGWHEQAVEHYRAASLDDPEALTDLGLALFRLRRYGEARPVFERVLALSRALGDRVAEGAALVGIGTCHQREGHHLQALAWHTEAYWVCARAGCEPGRRDADRGMAAALAGLDRRR
ncbi:MAG TPA: tetratricopeptide repeat protein [Mycobacteriales bacterium]|nr:tetratricopeptide repeat protein [Mycobacteriales bacterium]